MKKTVLFLCTHNSARSQMAEGFLNALYGDRYEAQSAGTAPTAVNPYAVQVMAEVGIDISTQRSKSIEAFREEVFDYVVTVCNRAQATCPFFPGKTILHQSFRDPSEFTGSEGDIVNQVRRVRDEIKSWIDETFQVLELR